MTKNGDIVISDLDIAGYTINGVPISDDDFMKTFAYRFNSEYGNAIITHGHLANGFDDPKVVAALLKEGGDKRISGLLNEVVYLFDANGYRGSMKYYEYYRDFVIKGTDPNNILKLR